MNKNKILSDYRSKISRLNEFNKNYYQLDKPLVPDSEFDELKKEAKMLAYRTMPIFRFKL